MAVDWAFRNVRQESGILVLSIFWIWLLRTTFSIFSNQSGVMKICFALHLLQIDFDISDHWAQPIIYGSESSWSSNLKLILDWSPFASKEELLRQVLTFYFFLLFFFLLRGFWRNGKFSFLSTLDHGSRCGGNAKVLRWKSPCPNIVGSALHSQSPFLCYSRLLFK